MRLSLTTQHKPRSNTMAIKQKEAVYSMVVNFKGNDFKAPCTLTEDEHAKVTEMLAEGFVKGEIAHRTPAKVATIDSAKIYAKGLLSNWLRRDPRLAGTTPAPTPAAQ